jgi:hypothetical protein
MTNEDYAKEKDRMSQQQAINQRQRQYLDEIDAKHAAEADIIRKQQARDLEISLRRQEIAARNRQADAAEAAAAAASDAARSAAIAAQNAAQRNNAPPPVSPPRSMHCNFSNGWCD